MVSADSETRIYGALRARGIAVLSVGHRESLKPLHDSILELSSLR